MDGIPHVTRVTDVTGSSEPSRNGKVSYDIRERIETLTDAVATANRAAIAHQRALDDLTTAVVFAMGLLVGLYVIRGRR